MTFTPVAAGAARHEDAQAAPMVTFEGVIKRFGDGVGAFTALDGVDLDVGRGEIIGIIGRSGAGKSTLIRLVNGLEKRQLGARRGRRRRGRRPDRGGLRGLQRASRHDLPALQPALLAHRLRQRRAAAGGRRRSTSARDRGARSIALLDLVGLADKARAIRPNCRAGRSSASASPGRSPPTPKVLLSDEATSALDPETTRVDPGPAEADQCASSGSPSC